MNYIIHENSIEISKHFYRLSRPDSVRPPDEDGHSMYPVFTHPVSLDVAFGFDIDKPVLVHHDWDGIDYDILTDLIGLNPGQSNGFNNKIQSTIVIPQGQEPPSGHVLGRFPSSAIMNQVGEIKSIQWMIDNGWFPSEEIEQPSMFKKAVTWVKKLFN